MDALFESIKVQDLLSSSNLNDPTTPLSAPDLRLLIQRLESHSLQIKTKIQSYLLTHHGDFFNLFTLCNDAISRSNQISDDFSDLVNLIFDSLVDIEISNTVKEMTAKSREMRTKKELLELVRAIVGITEKLSRVKEDMKSGRLRFVAEELKQVKESLRISDDADQVSEGEPVVYGLLRNEWSACFEEIQDVLLKLVENAVLFEQESSRVRVRNLLTDGGITQTELHTVLEALDVIGILDYGLAKVADMLIKHVIFPAVNYGSPVAFMEEFVQDSDKRKEAILKIIPSHDHMFENEGEALYSKIIQVIRFVYKCICFENGSWIRSFGRLTWPKISELIVSNFLSKVVPQDASKLADFQKIIEQTSQFEASLKEMLFISASGDDRLSNYAENVEVHFASRKKMEMLANARNLLLRCDFSIPKEHARRSALRNGSSDVKTSENVVQLLFLSERCVVSKAGIQLMELVHQILKDICMSSARVALVLYHAVRDVLLLYEVVVPVKLERQLNGINQVAVLMHNDCLYLSQELLGLSFEYRPDFPSSLKEHAVFVDMAPRFHVMAEDILQRQIRLVIYNSKEAINGADGFQNTHQTQEFESAKFSIDQVVFILEKVHIIWEPLLMPSTYKKSMCMILESVFSRITRDILLLDDMAAEETLQLQKLIHLMLESLSSLLESLAALHQMEKSQEGAQLSLHNLVPSLLKIRKLAELLDMPLKSVKMAWESGDLPSCGFSSSEVQNFIKAIFADSPLRKECLWRIENAHF